MRFVEWRDKVKKRDGYLDQHIVPKFLIKRFINEDGYYEVLKPGEKIKSRVEWYTGNDYVIKKDNKLNGFMSGFKIYDLSERFVNDTLVNGDSLPKLESLEIKFNSIETNTKVVLEKWFLSASNVINLNESSSEDINQIVKFIMMLNIKNPNLKEPYGELWKKSIIGLIKAEYFISGNNLEDYNFYDIVYLIGLDKFTELTKMAFGLNNLYILKNNTREPFVLSETGCVPFNRGEPIAETLKRGKGKFDTIYLPIDPFRAFLLTKHKLKGRSSTVYVDETKRINFYNHLSFVTSKNGIMSRWIGNGMIDMLKEGLNINVERKE